MDCVRCGKQASRNVHIDGSRRPDRPVCNLCWAELVVWFSRNEKCPDGHQWLHRVNHFDHDYLCCNRCGLINRSEPTPQNVDRVY